MAQMLFDPGPDEEPAAVSAVSDWPVVVADLADLDDDQVLDYAGGWQRMVNLAQAEVLKIACRWADLNTALDPAASPGLPGMEDLVALGGEGTPVIAEFAPVELAAQLQLSPAAAAMLIGDALDLRHRLPRLWQLICSGEVKSWVGRQTAKATRGLSVEAAAGVDATVARYAGRVTGGRLQALIESAVIAADPTAAADAAATVRDSQGVWISRDAESGFKTLFARAAGPDLDALDSRLDAIADELAAWGDSDGRDLRRAKALGVLAAGEAVGQPLCPAEPADRCAPAAGTSAAVRTVMKRPSAGKAVLYVHICEAALRGRYDVARVEDLGPVLLGQVREWLGHRDVTVKPVIDLNRPIRAVDAYETPADIAEAVHLRSPADCFPFATATSRRTGDLDHTKPYLPPDDGGPPGQTRVDNLGRLSRFHHRVKTHSRWKVKQVRSGVWVWTSPHRRHYLVDHTGTIPLGKL